MVRTTARKKLRASVLRGIRGAVAANIGVSSQAIGFNHPLGDGFRTILTRVVQDNELTVDSFVGFSAETTIAEAADLLLS